MRPHTASQLTKSEPFKERGKLPITTTGYPPLAATWQTGAKYWECAMFKLALAFVSLVFLTANPALAAPSPQSNWVVTQLTGDARVVHPGAQPASLEVNKQLAPGDTLMTGPTGRATLVRGGDYIIVAPRSELRLPSTPQPSGFTRVIQNLGTLLFKVQHTGIPHFAVDTPMLAAVVKGTTFTVVVDGQRSAVQVLQGVVQVSAMDGGMSRMVAGGRTVFVNHDRPRMLLDADRPAAPTKAPSSTSVSVSAAGESPLPAIAALTGGLVRADLSAPQSAVLNAQTSVTAMVPTVDADNSSSPSRPAPVASGSPPVVTAPTAATSPTMAIIPAANSTVTSAPVTVVATATPVVTAPTATVPAVTTPTVTVPIVTTSTVTVPSISIGSNSGPGSMNSGSGSMNSGPGSISSGSGSAPTVTIAPVTTPTVTVPTLTTPTITTPLVTVPSISTPTVTAPTVTTPTVTVPTVTTILAPITNLLKL
jgi:hypothetical protein